MTSSPSRILPPAGAAGFFLLFQAVRDNVPYRPDDCEPGKEEDELLQPPQPPVVVVEQLRCVVEVFFNVLGAFQQKLYRQILWIILGIFGQLRVDFDESRPTMPGDTAAAVDTAVVVATSQSFSKPSSTWMRDTARAAVFQDLPVTAP